MIERLVVDLDHDSFTVREEATNALKKLGPAAGGARRQPLANPPSPEVRRRAEVILEVLATQPTTPEVRRESRCLQVLEQVATPAARQLVEALSRGDDGARLTAEARGTLQRWKP
jgi:hypothetical protein